MQHIVHKRSTIAICLLTLTAFLGVLALPASKRVATVPVYATSSYSDPILLAEIRDAHSSTTSRYYLKPPLTSMVFAVGYDSTVVSPLTIGGELRFASGQTGYYDFTASNSANFNAVISHITNGIDEDIWTCAYSVDSNNALSSPSGCSGGPESGRLDGINKPSDLIGKSVGFIRLIVNKVSVSTSADNLSDTEEHDVIWQFWDGSPLSSGGGQRSDVDDFLMFANPLQESTALPAGSSSFPITIIYGTTISTSTFQATLNGQPFGGFHPVAGTSETVSVPLSQGRNVLLLTVDGVRADGRTATDRDRLIFLVP